MNQNTQVCLIKVKFHLLLSLKIKNKVPNFKILLGVQNAALNILWNILKSTYPKKSRSTLSKMLCKLLFLGKMMITILRVEKFLENQVSLTSQTQIPIDISKISVQEEEGENGEDERDFQEDNVNNSLALVPIDLPKPKETIDPIVLDATVREVLNALRHAKEKLQTRMERGRTIKVG
ncbi:hypothetical protein P3L10_028688 [Capsicum annuum]